MKLKGSGRKVQAEEASLNRPCSVAVVSGRLMIPELTHPTAAERRRTAEGEAVMYKRLAGVDVVHIELQTEDPWEIIRACQLLEPRFAGLKLQIWRRALPRSRWSSDRS